MAVPGAEDVYLTLLLSDTYLPGALVLAHSLRDGGTTKKLGCMVTLDSVSAEAITQLKTVYDYILPVPRIRNAHPANLSLMNRTDLHSAFTKINLWKLVNFRKIVYIDADVVAYRAPDELFGIKEPFAAAPDIGWPDLFNSGVMVLAPNLGDYYALMAMAERGISFDGADQGLLNMHFQQNYKRLSFTYNVTPSAHYQYVPAYRHFQSSINMVHFIGADKPWFKGRYASTGSSTFDEMTGRWWAVYDRHYRIPSPTLTETLAQPKVELVQYLTKGEYNPPQPQAPAQATHLPQFQTTGEPYSEQHGSDRSQHVHYGHPEGHPPHHHEHSHDGDHHHYHHHQDQSHHHHHHQDGQDHHGQDHSQAQYHYQHHVEPQPGGAMQPSEQSTHAPSASFNSSIEGTEAEARKEQVPGHSHGAPPPPSEPEQNRPEPHPITFSDWDAQRHPPPTNSRPEAANFPATVYEMSRDSAPFVPPERYPSPPRDMWYQVPKDRPAPPTEKPKSIFPWEANQAPPTRVFAEPPRRLALETEMWDTPTESSTADPITPITPTIHVSPSDPWTSFSRTNAWDEVPEIERYVDAMQKHRRSRSLKGPGKIELPGGGGELGEIGVQRRGSKLTDFPSEAERPSLPVTPAPIRRPKFWGGGGPGIGDGEDEDPLLPRAEGVPEQTEWDPVAQLQKLAKQQSEALLQRLGGAPGKDSDDMPQRPLPFGSEELMSPTYVAQSAHGVLSPQPVKGSASSSMVRGIVSDDEATPRAAPPRAAGAPEAVPMSQPSYTGPGATFEKGEDYLTQETPMPPSEEEKDVLET